MSLRNRIKLAFILIVSFAVLCAAFFIVRHILFKTKSVPAVWRESFIPTEQVGTASAPKGWLLKSKPGTRPAVFSVERGKDKGLSFLHMEADKASASLVTKLDGIDLNKTPILRWRWRATTLPQGGDGRYASKDDQAIGIYIGTGSIINNKSVSYRWDTDTPKGSEGKCAYGMGTIKIKWYTLQNKTDAADDKWFTEERNVAEDFKKAWGFCPDNVYLSISCNSQYTKSRAIADLSWIEFTAAKNKKAN